MQDSFHPKCSARVFLGKKRALLWTYTQKNHIKMLILTAGMAVSVFWRDVFQSIRLGNLDCENDHVVR